MGKGDKKTRRGKIVKGSYGVLRPRKKSKTTPEKSESKKTTRKKTKKAKDSA